MPVTLDLNEREIAPLGIWVKGTTKSAIILRLTSFCGYDFKNSYGEIYYQISVDDANKTVVASGSYAITSQVFQDWVSAGDARFFEFVANQLGLTLV